MDEPTSQAEQNARKHALPPPLRRALMRVRPEFFTWPLPEQEHYGAAIPSTDALPIESALLKDLFSITDADQELMTEQQNRLNETLLPLTGIGEDCFYLNEWLGEGVTLLDFATVCDYDRDDHRFQEESRVKEDATYIVKPYRGDLHHRWARLFVDGRFTYATLSSAARHILSAMQGHADELVDELVPHRYVRGSNHGKRMEKGYQWNMQVDAGGKEGLLDDLRDNIYSHLSIRYDELAENWYARAPRCVFIAERSIPGENNMDFVFSDPTAMQAVRFRSFLRDCRAIERPFAELEAEHAQALAQIDSFMRETHQTLEKNFDPKLAKLRKRRTVIIHEDIADELL